MNNKIRVLIILQRTCIPSKNKWEVWFVIAFTVLHELPTHVENVLPFAMPI